MEGIQNLNIDSIHQLDDIADSCDTPPISPSKDKRKKKKKKSKNSSGNNRSNIYAFDEAKQQKLAEERASNLEKQLVKSSTFPSSAPCPVPLRTAKAFEFEDAHGFNSSPTSPCLLSRSCPSLSSLRSALRGGQEGLGLGPRPKLHVKWAVDVHDPPKSSVSHTLNLNRNSKKKKSKSNKLKVKTTKGGPKSQNQRGMQEEILASDSHVPEAEEIEQEQPHSEEIKLDASSPMAEPKFAEEDHPTWLSSENFFASMEVAMQHMLLASNFIEKDNVAGALIEYKAAANVFRLAKLDAETEGSDGKTAVKQAIRGQVLAWIAMATLYSASGQLSKGQKCHNLALQACQDVGLSFADSIECIKQDCSLEKALESYHFKSNNNNHCSIVALASSACEKLRNGRTCGTSRTEII